ncbi:uncharacterized protein BJ171DRAFT_278947 [Polychytrium aggregatum]|uniref:uncharacterized protein n=1 Tax=Polychytrium aggregatum TaxID=110093 RepID=UPI0022FEEAA4|nr:uncharacterized protein BJ171DRAFT_278947 [Polychytrium aggregatum]KAI9207653.1 hypothetical protein BJ171DRAFT_278947 [Polychytrium aggregatum]
MCVAAASGYVRMVSPSTDQHLPLVGQLTVGNPAQAGSPNSLVPAAGLPWHHALSIRGLYSSSHLAPIVIPIRYLSISCQDSAQPLSLRDRHGTASSLVAALSNRCAAGMPLKPLLAVVCRRPDRLRWTDRRPRSLIRLSTPSLEPSGCLSTPPWWFRQGARRHRDTRGHRGRQRSRSYILDGRGCLWHCKFVRACKATERFIKQAVHVIRRVLLGRLC